MQCLVILCILFSFTGSSAHDPDRISVNCGGAAALGGRKWGGDAANRRGGSSTTSTVEGHLITAVDPVPYSTTRISRSRFSYSFRLTTGQKFIRLHFNPAPYHGFESFHDLFTVEAGPFTLLANFSASITARALSLAILAREFCIIVQENQPLNIVFVPETRHNYAFINGIEIVSVPSTISYCHGGDIGVDVLGQKSVIYVDSDTALERVYHQNMKWGSVSFGDDMFGIWESILKGNGNKASNLSWTVSVDVGFRYLVRVHLFEVGRKMDFMLMIDNIVALTSADMLKQSENQSILWYNYMVMVQGKKREGKRSISISLHSQNELVDRQGPLEGFEIFKLSNHHLSLATPNPPTPPPPSRGLSSIPTLLRSLLGRKNAIAAVLFTNMFLVNIIVHLLHTMWGTDTSKEENEPSARAKRHCRCFSLAEIQSATENFHSKNFIGQGGFGQVHRGFMDNGREIVAVKRLKRDSHQGGQQFWTEVKMLSELRHVNLVPLLGFCEEQHEMILVYEYMACGTLADHLFKLAHKSRDYIPLSWKQRLKICIGAGRAIDYLHTGHGIIHRDVKSSNILLDEKLVAKVSDFGLAKTGFGSESQSQHSTQIRGTHGYMDPYYRETHKPTKNSDTYSFGVVLLEVLCGRRALERYVEEDKCHLPTWALENISKGQVDHIVYPSLAGEISPDSLKTFVSVAERCLHNEPKKRPAMTDVLVKLLLALQQQEKTDSLDTNEGASIENLLSSADNYGHKEIMNEKISIADALPQMENVAPNEIRNNRAILSSSLKPMASPSNRKTVRFLPSEQIKSSMINSGRKGGKISMMLRISQKLWPWDAFWKTRKPSNKTDLVGTSISAPISRRTSSATMDGNTKRTSGMTSTTAMGPSNEREKYSQTMRVMRNISKGQVDDIVAQTLRGELSPDSLRMFDSTNERWLHDEPENHALQWQEMAESSPPKDRSVEDGSSSQEATTKLFGPNEKINVADDAIPTPAELVPSSTGTSSQEANVELFRANKRINVIDDASPSSVPPSAGTSLEVNVEHVGANEKRNVSNDAGPSELLPQPNLRVFSLAELEAATRKFRSDSVLGVGGFGTVYKGWLDDRATGKTTIVAVKKLNSESMQGFEEWQSEVCILGKLSHPNLVKLLGYAWEDKELLLVYEFMAKGNLENHLFRRAASVQSLPWDIRLKIIIGAARGMAFLHEAKNAVIYRDFKASNILLDGSYQAKLSDFGLAKMGPGDYDSHVSTRVMGTYGYAAPEYIATGHLYVKSDVYGFGVVLVELLTGLRAIDSRRPSAQHNLVDWIKPHLSDKRKLKRIIDVRLQGQYPTKSALHMARLALTCLEMDPRNRPSMQEIVHSLEGIASSHERNRASKMRPARATRK